MQLPYRVTSLGVGAALAVSTLAGCASLGNKEKGAIYGATGGAVIGAAVGNSNGSTSRGAIIGAVVGGAAGAIIGHQMDQQAKELEQNIPGATVARVGEGIQVTFASGLLFDFDSDRLRGEARTNLTELAQSLDKYPDTELVIVGHTDADGADDYNQRLSERRAWSAANHLIAQGVTAQRIRAVGRGETEPVAANDTDADKQRNRRVEVAIYANDKLKEQAKKQVAGR